MNFDLSVEQRLLRDSIDKLVANEYSFEKRNKYLQQADGWSREFWGRLAENGFMMGPFSEEQGGMGFGAEETMLVMDALGRGMCLEPFRETVITCGSILRRGASAQQVEEILPVLYEGGCIISLATTEKQSRFNLNDVATTAARDGEGFCLNGVKLVVAHGDSANKFIVSARTSGARSDKEGISLFLIDADAEGISLRRYATQDGMRAADVKLDNVTVSQNALIGELDMGFALLEGAEEETIAAMVSEAVGATQAVMDLTVDYLKQRKQFGVLIGSFQALQHRCAEMLIEIEQLRSMAVYAAFMLANSNAEERSQAISQVKLQISKSALFVAEQAVQLSGGIGVTEEYAAGHYLKRLRMMEARFGDRDYHLQRLTKFVKPSKSIS